MKRRIQCMILAVLMLCTMVPSISPMGTVEAAKQVKITKKERNAYFKKSAFIGSSLGVGQKMYMDWHEEDGYLGNPTMLVKGCYSFNNDTTSSQYCLTYKGKKYKAADAIAAAKVKRVFINMGTNDLFQSPETVYKKYVSYIKGIQKKNPKIVIFIESTTPMVASSQKQGLNNKSIKKLNQYMKEYCEKRKDIYYIDVAKGMRDSNNALISKYSSDNYVHLTMSAYEIWMDNVIDYVERLLLKEKKATKSVQIAERKLTLNTHQKALTQVRRLEGSTTRAKLIKRLQKVRKRIRAKQREERKNKENNQNKQNDENKGLQS